MVVSADAILQADATLVVGVVFIATLRQALKLPITQSFFRTLSWPIVCFLISAVSAQSEGVESIDGHDPWYLIGRSSFSIGLLLVFLAMYRTADELRKKGPDPT